MEYVKGQVLVSVAGHDKGELLTVTGFDGKRVYVCDGKGRGSKSPRLKIRSILRKLNMFSANTQWQQTEVSENSLTK